ncbi:MAG TPA: transcriptional regulator [Candidatus Thermoplasmatota archaeon]|jgi:DNA-binding MarR family transcriptional regulator|nr:transcriptional regulator [Candidatus Thermoplasmatota archaeon]
MALALDPLLHQPTRLQIMTALYRNRQVSFTDLRDGLALTPGNLASHTAKLEEAGYLKSGRVLVDLSFEVHYRITERGLEAFRGYMAALQEIVRGAGLAEGPAGDALPRKSSEV